MRNSQVAVLCATVIAGSLIVAGTNVWLVRSPNRLAADGRPPGLGRPLASAELAMMPKAKVIRIS